jgi:hypothetical protein
MMRSGVGRITDATIDWMNGGMTHAQGEATELRRIENEN